MGFGQSLIDWAPWLFVFALPRDLAPKVQSDARPDEKLGSLEHRDWADCLFDGVRSGSSDTAEVRLQGDVGSELHHRHYADVDESQESRGDIAHEVRRLITNALPVKAADC
jgi:hypothetical protein